MWDCGVVVTPMCQYARGAEDTCGCGRWNGLFAGTTYVRSARPFTTFADIELDIFAVLKFRAAYFGVMHEEVAALFLLDESVALLGVEPFYFTLRHRLFSNALLFYCVEDNVPCIDQGVE